MPKTPSVGRSCKTKKCKTKAQKGHDGYCAACFRRRFPRASARRLKQNLKDCSICGKSGFVRKHGICHVCTNARKCSKCDVIDMNPSAPTCRLCSLSGQPARVAISCASCFTEEERSTGLCSTCLTPRCDHCESKDNSKHKMLEFTCSEASCGRPFRICVWCYPQFRDVGKLQCKACWHRTGDVCVDCGSRTGRCNRKKKSLL